MTKEEARKELLETLEEYCYDKGYNLQVFAGMANWVYTLYPEKKTMTNREWLASMTDKELAIWLCQISNCTYCEFIKYCSREGKGTNEWLKMEHKTS